MSAWKPDFTRPQKSAGDDPLQLVSSPSAGVTVTAMLRVTS